MLWLEILPYDIIEKLVTYFKDITELHVFSEVFPVIVKMRHFRRIALKANWRDLSTSGKLSGTFLKKFRRFLQWDNVSQYHPLTDEFIKKYSKRIYWVRLSMNGSLTPNLMEKYSNKLDWEKISLYQKLPSEFIDKNHDKVNWGCIWENTNIRLPESILMKYMHTFDQSEETWDTISYRDELSEEFIADNYGEVNWNYVSSCQKISEPFIREWYYYISWEDLWSNKHVSISDELEEDLYAGCFEP